MASLYLISTEGEVGKTAIVIGLALELSSQGLKVGYMKPLGVRLAELEGRPVEADAVFMRRTLGLEASPDALCPVLLTNELRRQTIIGHPSEASTVLGRFERLSQNQDLMILEGPPTMPQGRALGISPGRVAALCDAKGVLILRGEYQLLADQVLCVQDLMGGRLIGVLVNAAPVEPRPDEREEFRTFLERNNLQLFGVLPRDPLLGAFTVAEISELLNGRQLTVPNQKDDLVEEFIVGAMGAESALRYFLRLANKAVITGGDRTDIILAALDTPTRCIVLTGNLLPDQVALTCATERSVPVILVPLDTLETVRRIEAARGPIRLVSDRQIERVRETIRREVDLSALKAALGLAENLDIQGCV